MPIPARRLHRCSIAGPELQPYALHHGDGYHRLRVYGIQQGACRWRFREALPPTRWHGWIGFGAESRAIWRRTGTYGFTVTDAHGCTVSGSSTLTGTTAARHWPCRLVPETCWRFGAATGRSGCYGYRGGTGALCVVRDTSEDLLSLAAGYYALTVTDAASCTLAWSDATYTLDTATAALTLTTDDPHCLLRRGYWGAVWMLRLTVLGSTALIYCVVIWRDHGRYFRDFRLNITAYRYRCVRLYRYVDGNAASSAPGRLADQTKCWSCWRFPLRR